MKIELSERKEKKEENFFLLFVKNSTIPIIFFFFSFSLPQVLINVNSSFDIDRKKVCAYVFIIIKDIFYSIFLFYFS